MAQSAPERFYNLLPLIYQQRDVAAGQPLRALLNVMEAEFTRLEVDINAAYDDWFVETCNSWVLPYLADLVGITDLSEQDGTYLGQRRRIANHIAYQRRKGHLSVLTHVLQDVTGWPAYGVETGRLVAQTLPGNADLEDASHTFNVRDMDQMPLVGTPFDTHARTLDVRQINATSGGRSQYGLSVLGAIALYVWHMQSYPLNRAQAGVQKRIGPAANTRHFSFDPLGNNMPLFIFPEAIDDLDALLQPRYFPQPISRAMLTHDLAKAGTDMATTELYGPDRSLAVWIADSYIYPHEILCGRLRSHNSKRWLELLNRLDKKVVIDPENGRILVEKRVPANAVSVRYAYGSYCNLGGGPYSRSLHHEGLIIGVTKEVASQPSSEFTKDNGWTFSSLAAALDFWQQQCLKPEPKARQVTIRFLDSHIYQEEPLDISLPNGSYLKIEVANGERPVIISDRITVHVAHAFEDSNAKENAVANAYADLATAEVDETKVDLGENRTDSDQTLALNGVFLDGGLDIMIGSGKLDLKVEHCTILKGLTAGMVESDLKDVTQRLHTEITGSILGTVAIECSHGAFDMSDSIVDPVLGLRDNQALQDQKSGGDAESLPALKTRLSGRTTYVTNIARTTIFGDVTADEVDVVDSLLLGNTNAGGRASHSFLKAISQKEAVALNQCVTAPEEPIFTSRELSQPGYAQLAANVPSKIRYGASNGAEMGAHNNLNIFRRESNLEHIQFDYLPLGYALGVFNVT